MNIYQRQGYKNRQEYLEGLADDFGLDKDTVTVDIYLFRQQFIDMNRSENFTYEGLGVLFEYLTDLEHCEEEYELDVIALCCDFAEGTPKEIADDYEIDLPDTEGMDEDQAADVIAETVREYLEDEGVFVGETDDTLVYRQF